MKMIERWMIRRLQKMCREKSNCDARCPYFRAGHHIIPCKVGMPWSWQTEANDRK